MTMKRSLQISEDKPQIRSPWTVRVSFNEIRGVLNTPPPDLPSPAPLQISSPCPHTPRCARCPAPPSHRAAESDTGCLAPWADPLPAGGGPGAGRRRAALPSLPSLLPLSLSLRRRCGRGVLPPSAELPAGWRGAARCSAELSRPWGCAPPGSSAAAACCPSSFPQPQVRPTAGSAGVGRRERGEQRTLGVCRGERSREGRRVGKVWGVWRGGKESGGGTPAAPRGQSRPGSGQDAGGLEGAFPLHPTERISCAICVGCQ